MIKVFIAVICIAFVVLLLIDQVHCMKSVFMFDGLSVGDCCKLSVKGEVIEFKVVSLNFEKKLIFLRQIDNNKVYSVTENQYKRLVVRH